MAEPDEGFLYHFGDLLGEIGATMLSPDTEPPPNAASRFKTLDPEALASTAHSAGNFTRGFYHDPSEAPQAKFPAKPKLPYQPEEQVVSQEVQESAAAAAKEQAKPAAPREKSIGEIEGELGYEGPDHVDDTLFVNEGGTQVPESAGGRAVHTRPGGGGVYMPKEEDVAYLPDSVYQEAEKRAGLARSRQVAKDPGAAAKEAASIEAAKALAIEQGKANIQAAQHAHVQQEYAAKQAQVDQAEEAEVRRHMTQPGFGKLSPADREAELDKVRAPFKMQRRIIDRSYGISEPSTPGQFFEDRQTGFGG